MPRCKYEDALSSDWVFTSQPLCCSCPNNRVIGHRYVENSNYILLCYCLNRAARPIPFSSVNNEQSVSQFLSSTRNYRLRSNTWEVEELLEDEETLWFVDIIDPTIARIYRCWINESLFRCKYFLPSEMKNFATIYQRSRDAKLILMLTRSIFYLWFFL